MCALYTNLSKTIVSYIRSSIRPFGEHESSFLGVHVDVSHPEN